MLDDFPGATAGDAPDMRGGEYGDDGKPKVKFWKPT